MKNEKTSVWDAAEHLITEADIAAYLKRLWKKTIPD
jgi:hypothetical protein